MAGQLKLWWRYFAYLAMFQTFLLAPSPGFFLPKILAISLLEAVYGRKVAGRDPPHRRYTDAKPTLD